MKTCMYGGDKRLRSFAGAQATSSMTVAFGERRRGQVPLNFDKGRNQREEVCDEGVGLRGESQVSNDFPKIVDKIPDDRGWNRGKPGVG